MKYLSLVLVLLSFSAQAATIVTCELSWNANPVEEKITFYSVYRDGILLEQVKAPNVGDPVPTKHSFTCDLNKYSVSASNLYGLESDKSVSIDILGQITEPAEVIPPALPGGVQINIFRPTNVIFNP